MSRTSRLQTSKPKKLDIRSVAKAANVSTATVSRTINRVSTVDPLLAARVWKAVKALNYVPNTQARALVSGRSRLLGLIISEITNPFFPELIQQFETVAVEHGYEILIGSTSYDRARMEQCVQRMLARKVDGVAIMTFGMEQLLLDQFAVGGIPVTFIDAGPMLPRSSVLVVDYARGIREGVEHLVGLGHREIGFISGPLKLRSAKSRKAAFLESMERAGLPVSEAWLVEGDHTLEGGRAAIEGLLALEQRPTAVMCSNDMTAIGVQHGAYQNKVRVPEELSLIGFDDVHLAEYTIPPLTTVRMACSDLARGAVGLLLASLAGSATGKVAEQAVAEISTRLIVRATTGPPAQQATPPAQAKQPGTKRQARPLAEGARQPGRARARQPR